MPKNACWITQTEHPDSPRLHLWGLAHDPWVLLREFKPLNVFPPCVSVLDAQAHHEISCMLCDVERLQKESERTDLKFCNLLVTPVDRKTKISIEPAAPSREARPVSEARCISEPAPDPLFGMGADIEQGSLHRLEYRGWIRARWGASENNRRARFYALTAAGRRQLDAELENWDRLTGAVNLVLQGA